jgi:hypothetical protein
MIPITTVMDLHSLEGRRAPRMFCEKSVIDGLPCVKRKMVGVLHVYKDVEIVNAGLAEGTLKEPAVVRIPL